jgi:hypothetical protein
MPGERTATAVKVAKISPIFLAFFAPCAVRSKNCANQPGLYRHPEWAGRTGRRIPL